MVGTWVPLNIYKVSNVCFITDLEALGKRKTKKKKDFCLPHPQSQVEVHSSPRLTGIVRRFQRPRKNWCWISQDMAHHQSWCLSGRQAADPCLVAWLAGVPPRKRRAHKLQPERELSAKAIQVGVWPYKFWIFFLLLKNNNSTKPPCKPMLFCSHVMVRWYLC